MSDENTLPAPVARRGIDEPTWRALMNSVYPGAQPESVLMVWDYCAARRLDPLKKVAHIVPMKVKDGRTGEYKWRDVVMPGIAELRITANRTGQYAGMDAPQFGPIVEYQGLSVPESCTVVVYKLMNGERVPFTHTEFFEEAVSTKSDGQINSMWKKRPRGQLSKCAEAGALRKAFPEELGNQVSAEEMHGKSIDGSFETVDDDEPVAAGVTSATASDINSRVRQNAEEQQGKGQQGTRRKQRRTKPASKPHKEETLPTMAEITAAMSNANDIDTLDQIMDSCRDRFSGDDLVIVENHYEICFEQIKQ